MTEKIMSVAFFRQQTETVLHSPEVFCENPHSSNF
jgi:hypothetical protein